MSEEINTGGPAFPLGSTQEEWANGMTLRDYFAAKAMQSFCIDEGWISNIKHLSGYAYEIADAMLEAREGEGRIK